MIIVTILGECNNLRENMANGYLLLLLNNYQAMYFEIKMYSICVQAKYGCLYVCKSKTM